MKKLIYFSGNFKIVFFSSINLDALQRAIQDGQEVGKEVQKALMDKIVQEERMGIGRKKIGFLK